VAVLWSARLAIGKLRVQLSAKAILCTKVYSAFYPSGVSKWVPAAAGKATHSDCGWTCGCAGKTV